MIGLKNSYEIAYNGTENECRFELYADTAADLQGVTHYDGIKIQMGSECTDISTGDKYILNSSGAWILQPSDRAFSNVYTKPEIDSMTTEIYGIIAYYHTTLVSDTGEIAFYALAGYIGTWTIYGNGQQTGTPTPDAPIPFIGCGTREVYEVSVTYPSSAYTYEVRNGGLIDAIKQLGAGRYTFSWEFQSNATGTFKDRLRLYVNGVNKQEIENGQTRKFTETLVQEIQTATHFSIQLYYGQGNTDGYFKNFVIDAGYKIPITCGGQTNNIYLSAPLRKAIDGTDAVDTLQSTGTLTRNVDENGDALVAPTTETITVPDIPTVQGENTLTVDTDLKPSKIEISGER